MSVVAISQRKILWVNLALTWGWHWTVKNAVNTK